MKILGDLNKQGTAIVMVTHSPDYAKYAHRTVHLFDGKISNEKVNGN
jgi:putative ABC transport system ATP-binding protein